MLNRICGTLGVAALLAASALAAHAHATLEKTEAAPNSTYRGVVRISHGCNGSPTTLVRVHIPEGVIGAKPMPKPGWTLAIDKGAYARSYNFYHGQIAEGAKAIAWSGGRLNDSEYDEFVFSAFISDAFAPGAAVYFPIDQECADGVSHWAEIPASGQDAHALKAPAPGLRIVAAATSTTVTQPVKAGALQIETPWLRATPGGANVAAGYVRITNTGAEADRLLGAAMPLAARGEVHGMAMQDGVMRMHPLSAGLTVEPGKSIELRPGGFHLMFVDLQGALKEGDRVPVTLTFEKAGKVAVTFPVGGIGGGPPAPAGHEGH